MSRFFTDGQCDIKILGSQNQLLNVAFRRDIIFGIP